MSTVTIIGQLFTAIYHNDIARCERLLANNDINLSNGVGAELLPMALQIHPSEHLSFLIARQELWIKEVVPTKICQLLINSGANCTGLEIPNRIFYITEDGGISLLTNVFKQGGSVSNHPRLKSTELLALAIKIGAEAAFDRIIAENPKTLLAELAIPHRTDGVLLESACKGGNIKIIKNIAKYTYNAAINDIVGKLVADGEFAAFCNASKAGLIDAAKCHNTLEARAQEAVKANDYDIVTTILRLDTNIAIHENNQQSLINIAVEENDLDAIELFADAGFDMQQVLNEAIYASSQSTEVVFADQLVEVILEFGQGIDYNDAFMTAISNGCVSIAEQIFEYGVDLNAEVGFFTVLHHLLTNESIDISEFSPSICEAVEAAKLEKNYGDVEAVPAITHIVDADTQVVDADTQVGGNSLKVLGMMEQAFLLKDVGEA